MVLCAREHKAFTLLSYTCQHLGLCLHGFPVLHPVGMHCCSGTGKPFPTALEQLQGHTINSQSQCRERLPLFPAQPVTVWSSVTPEQARSFLHRAFAQAATVAGHTSAPFLPALGTSLNIFPPVQGLLQEPFGFGGLVHQVTLSSFFSGVRTGLVLASSRIQYTF